MYFEEFTEKDVTYIIFYGEYTDLTEKEFAPYIESEKYKNSPCYYMKTEKYNTYEENIGCSMISKTIGTKLHIISTLYIKSKDKPFTFSSISYIPLYGDSFELYKIILYKHVEVQIKFINTTFDENFKIEDYKESINKFVESYYYHK